MRPDDDAALDRLGYPDSEVVSCATESLRLLGNYRDRAGFEVDLVVNVIRYHLRYLLLQLTERQAHSFTSLLGSRQYCSPEKGGGWHLAGSVIIFRKGGLRHRLRRAGKTRHQV